MLIWQRLKNTLTQMGYARAAANLAQQGLYDQARILMLEKAKLSNCLLYTSPSPRDRTRSRMPSSA